MGYVFQFGNGPKIYVTGDTDYSALLLAAGKFSPDLVITCIHGGFNNLSHWEAARLVRGLNPRATPDPRPLAVGQGLCRVKHSPYNGIGCAKLAHPAKGLADRF
jgi:hypothetical protein